MNEETVRSTVIDEALQGWVSLQGVLSTMTEAEVLHALELEAGTRRRESILTRLIQKAVRLNELKYTKTLKERFLCPTQNQQ